MRGCVYFTAWWIFLFVLTGNDWATRGQWAARSKGKELRTIHYDCGVFECVSVWVCVLTSRALTIHYLHRPSECSKMPPFSLAFSSGRLRSSHCATEHARSLRFCPLSSRSKHIHQFTDPLTPSPTPSLLLTSLHPSPNWQPGAASGPFGGLQSLLDLYWDAGLLYCRWIQW